MILPKIIFYLLQDVCIHIHVYIYMREGGLELPCVLGGLELLCRSGKGGAGVLSSQAINKNAGARWRSFEVFTRLPQSS